MWELSVREQAAYDAYMADVDAAVRAYHAATDAVRKARDAAINAAGDALEEASMRTPEREALAVAAVERREIRWASEYFAALREAAFPAYERAVKAAEAAWEATDRIAQAELDARIAAAWEVSEERWRIARQRDAVSGPQYRRPAS
jgi:hypothetical protein